MWVGCRGKSEGLSSALPHPLLEATFLSRGKSSLWKGALAPFLHPPPPGSSAQGWAFMHTHMHTNACTFSLTQTHLYSHSEAGSHTHMLPPIQKHVFSHRQKLTQEKVHTDTDAHTDEFTYVHIQYTHVQCGGHISTCILCTQAHTPVCTQPNIRVGGERQEPGTLNRQGDKACLRDSENNGPSGT